MTFVDPEVTKLKLDNEIECWHASAPLYRKRGWILLERNGLEVDVGFLAQLSLGGQSVAVKTACVRFDYTNYDVWPPSVEFIDPCTGAFVAPVVPAIVQTDEGPRNLLVFGHRSARRGRSEPKRGRSTPSPRSLSVTRATP